MSTTRERREARAARLREWADKRERDAAAVIEADRVYTDDWAFNTQPGHIPIRARVIARGDRARESARKAAGMVSRADNIEAAADRAIYDDDPDVAERLTERIAELEAKRAAFKAHNREARKRGEDILPSYVLSNLGANIRRYKQRLAAHQSGAARRTREVTNRYAGTCDAVLVEAEGTRRCGVRVAAGEGVARKEHGGDWEVFCDEHR